MVKNSVCSPIALHKLVILTSYSAAAGSTNLFTIAMTGCSKFYFPSNETRILTKYCCVIMATASVKIGFKYCRIHLIYWRTFEAARISLTPWNVAYYVMVFDCLSPG